MTSKVVLVVENDDGYRWILSSALEKDGFTVVEADDGFGGLACLSTGSVPDLIISDVHMPGMDGLQFLKTLRKNHIFADVPVIICSHDATFTDFPIALDNVRTSDKELKNLLDMVNKTTWK